MDDYCDWVLIQHSYGLVAVAVAVAAAAASDENDDDDNVNDFISMWHCVVIFKRRTHSVASFSLPNCDATLMITTNLKLFIYDRRSFFFYVRVYAHVF